MLGRRKTTVYQVERPDGEKFVIFDFDVKGLNKSEAWFEQVSKVAKRLKETASE